MRLLRRPYDPNGDERLTTSKAMRPSRAQIVSVIVSPLLVAYQHTGRSLLAFATLAVLLPMVALASLSCSADSPIYVPVKDRVFSRPYSIVALPDTQYYATDSELNKIFKTQVDWVLNNADRLNVVFVTHLGDVVFNANKQQQWDNAVDSLQGLDVFPADLPYSISQGNHDVGKTSGEENAKFIEYFGPQHYEGRTWYVGASDNGLDHAQTFQANGRTFLHINFRYSPDETDLVWAQSIIDDQAYSGLPTIVSTHDYLECGGRSSVGDVIWDEFVTKNPQVFMTINGHTHAEYFLTSHDEAGKPVYQFLADYQDSPYGGNGLLRIFTFDEEAGTIKSRTYTPGFFIDYGGWVRVHAGYETGADSYFTVHTDLRERFDPDSTYDWGREPSQQELQEWLTDPLFRHVPVAA